MLGRESTTLLDIVYDMPSSWKQVPKNNLVWIMLDRMERAHNLVRRLRGCDPTKKASSRHEDVL